MSSNSSLASPHSSREIRGRFKELARYFDKPSRPVDSDGMHLHQRLYLPLVGTCSCPSGAALTNDIGFQCDIQKVDPRFERVDEHMAEVILKALEWLEEWVRTSEPSFRLHRSYYICRLRLLLKDYAARLLDGVRILCERGLSDLARPNVPLLVTLGVPSDQIPEALRFGKDGKPLSFGVDVVDPADYDSWFRRIRNAPDRPREFLPQPVSSSSATTTSSTSAPSTKTSLEARLSDAAPVGSTKSSTTPSSSKERRPSPLLGSASDKVLVGYDMVCFGSLISKAPSNGSTVCSVSFRSP